MTLFTLPIQTAKPDLLGNQALAWDLLVHITSSAFLANYKMMLDYGLQRGWEKAAANSARERAFLRRTSHHGNSITREG